MYDCAIIGAGVVGLSVAYELSQHGQHVCLIDRGLPGREASWAGAGILVPENFATATSSHEKLGGLSSELHPTWSTQLREETGSDNGYRPCGGLHVIGTEAEHAELLDTLNWFQQRRIPYEQVPAKALVEFVPAMAPAIQRGRIHEAYYLPGEAQLRNPRHLKALIKACQLRGVEIVTDAEVTGFDLSANRVMGVHTTGATIHAEQFCVTNGAWANTLLQQLDRNLKIKLKPVRGQMVMFGARNPLFRPVINEGDRYLVPRDDGRILVGSTEEDVGFVKSDNAESVAELFRFATGLIDELQDVPIEKTWCGLRPASPDRRPYLGPLHPWNNIFVAVGHFRSGLWLSTGTAIVMSELLRGETPRIDLTEFGLDRDRCMAHRKD